MNSDARTWGDDRGVMMMLVALLLLGMAVAGAVGTYRALEHERTVQVMEDGDALVDRFVEARAEGHRALGQRTPAVFGASAHERLEYLLEGLAGAGSSVGTEVSMGLAAGGVSSAGSERSFVDDGAYNVTGVGGGLFEGVAWDGVDDGMVHDLDGSLVAVVWFLEVRSDRGAVGGVVATVWEGNG